MHSAKSFLFENAWLREPMCYHLVEDVWSSTTGSFYQKLSQCSEILSVWGKEITGNFKERISKIKRTLKSLKGRRDNFSVKLVLEERKKLAEIYVQKEVFWRQRSKQLWLQEGDRNIKFFHSATKLRRKSNQINSLFDSLGNKVG